MCVIEFDLWEMLAREISRLSFLQEGFISAYTGPDMLSLSRARIACGEVEKDRYYCIEYSTCKFGCITRGGDSYRVPTHLQE